MNCRGRYNNTGSALLLVVVFLVIVSTFASSFIALVHINLNASNRAAHRQVCSALAEAGISKAAVKLSADAGYRGEPEFVLGAGEISIEVVPADDPGHFIVTSLGRYSKQDVTPFTITAELALENAVVRIVRWDESVR